MPPYTRSRARALLSSIEEHKTAAAKPIIGDSVICDVPPLVHANEAGSTESIVQRESTPRVAQMPVPQTPHTTDQSMPNALERAPKKRGLQRCPDRIGVHHGIDLYRMGGPHESWLQEKKMIMDGNKLRDVMQEEDDRGAQEKMIIPRELRALRQGQEVRSTMEQHRSSESGVAEGLPIEHKTRRLGPEGTLLVEDDHVSGRLGPEGTLLY